jgi:hypothetical protein
MEAEIGRLYGSHDLCADRVPISRCGCSMNVVNFACCCDCSEIKAFCSQTQVSGKWLCVVVKYEQADAFIVTAYLTNKPKAGEDLWPTRVKIWFDSEADYLEVQFKEAPGHMKETTHDAVMERVDSEGRVIGLSILGVSRFTKEKPLEAELTAA